MDDVTSGPQRNGCLGSNGSLVVFVSLIAGLIAIVVFIFSLYSSVNLGYGRIIYQREGARGQLQATEDFSRCLTRAATANMYDRDAQDRAIAACNRTANAAAQRESVAPLVASVFFTNQGPNAVEDVRVMAAFRDARGQVETHSFSRPVVGLSEVVREDIRLRSEPSAAIVCISYLYGPLVRMYVTMRGAPSLNTGNFMTIDGRMAIISSRWRVSFSVGCESDILAGLADKAG